MCDFAIEIGHLVKLGHPYLPVSERGSLAVEHLVRNLYNKQLQKHQLTADTSSISSSVLAIRSYMVIDNSGKSACEVTSETLGNHHFDKVVSMLTA